MNTLPFLRGQPGHFVWQAIELRSARAAHWARAATSAQERSARSGKQGPRQCLEVWSCLPLSRMAESSAGDFTAGKIQKSRRQRVAKMYGQQKRNIIHTSSTAYEQDHSAAAHNPRARRPRAMRILRSELPLAIAKEFDASPWACPKSICGRRTHG